MQLARKNFRLLVEGEPKGAASTLPVARVLRISGDSFQLDPKFAPPLLDFAANDFILAIARRLIEISRPRAARSPACGGKKTRTWRNSPPPISPISGCSTPSTCTSRTCGTCSRPSTGIPEELFRLMLSLASTLTTFSLRLQPRDLPVYDHENLGACFGELDEKLRDLLETVIPSNFVSLPLKLIRPSIYAASIFEDRFLENTSCTWPSRRKWTRAS